MGIYVIFGGAGFIGTHLAKHLLKSRRGARVHLADIRHSPLNGIPGVTTSLTDVRQLIPRNIVEEKPDWIFNLAAIHREPGHQPKEYFETNLAGARNVCAYAEQASCKNIYFTSSISVYGPTSGPTDENSPICPISPYGGSKYPAELIHEGWWQADKSRRLIICRPGVIYGPGDPGNILRMIRAIKRGYFAFPGSASLRKSYGYIYGLLDSIDFMMDSNLNMVKYNYVESPTEPLGNLVANVKKFLGSSAPVLPIPLSLLLPAAYTVQIIFGTRSQIHPTRVRKAATSTYIVPGVLKKMGFNFKYDFARSLEHWREIAPEDFK